MELRIYKYNYADKYLWIMFGLFDNSNLIEQFPSDKGIYVDLGTEKHSVFYDKVGIVYGINFNYRMLDNYKKEQISYLTFVNLIQDKRFLPNTHNKDNTDMFKELLETIDNLARCQT